MLGDLFINFTILITFTAICNNLFKESDIDSNSPVIARVFFGIIVGTCGCVLMLYRVNINDTVIMDFRSLPIILSAIYGGFLPTIITSLIIGGFRIIYFGLSLSSVVGLITAILMAISCSIIVNKIENKKNKYIVALIITNLIVAIGFALLIKDIYLLTKLITYFFIGTSLALSFLYKYINYYEEFHELFKKYKEESTKDFLTGLNNVRRFDDVFNNIVSNFKEVDGKLSLLYIDIDFFKKINDNYGHDNGDVILRELGDILIKACRTTDVVSRNGGEEFSVLLTNCDITETVKIAERIRKTVEEKKFTVSGGRVINITISVGVTSYPNISKDINNLIKDADVALYEAKHTGRNKVVIFHG